MNILAALKPSYWRELGRHFRNFNYEYDDNNDLLISHARIGGVFECEAPDGLGLVKTANLLTTEGCNYLLSAGIGNGAVHDTFYIAPFSGNVTVVDTWTAASFSGAATELTTQYSEATRVAYVESVPAAKSLNNTASPAEFTSAVDSVSIWGVGLLSLSTKGGATGVLLAAAKYSTVRSLPTTGDELLVRYTLTLANT